MARSRRTTICLEGWCYLVVLAFLFMGALLRDINLLLILFGLLVGLFLVSWRVVHISMRDLKFARHVPKRTVAGELLEVEIEVKSRRRRGTSWVVRVADQVTLEGAKNALRPATLFARIGPGTSRRETYRGRLNQRGRYVFGPLIASTRFPFGLLRRSTRVDQTDSLIVVPRLGRLTRRWQQSQQDVFEATHLARRRPGVVEGDFHGLRDWRSGDSRRWIHWRTSARQGELMVRQFEQHRNQDQLLILDLWQSKHAGETERDVVELAVSFAATIIAEACRQGGRHLAFGIAAQKQVFSRGTSSRAFLQDALDTLALARATSVDRLPNTLTRALDHVRANTDVLLISTRDVDLSDTGRFQVAWDNPRKRTWLMGAVCINAGAGELADYFEP